MSFASRFALLLLAAAWPVLVTGGAMWFPDIAPYVKGGHVAVQTVFGGPGETVGEAGADAVTVSETVPASGGGLAAQSGAAVSGVRSVAYSVTAYLTGLAAPRFLLLALLQAGVVAALTAALSARAGGSVWLWAGVLALSAAPLAASAAGPDVWAGIVLLAALLAFRHGRRHGRRLGRAETALVLAALAFGVAAHASHVPLAAALALGVLLLGTRRQRLAGA